MNNMKEHLPLVTLGIPIYNAAELVEKTLLLIRRIRIWNIC